MGIGLGIGLGLGLGLGLGFAIWRAVVVGLHRDGGLLLEGRVRHLAVQRRVVVAHRRVVDERVEPAVLALDERAGSLERAWLRQVHPAVGGVAPFRL